MRGLELRHEDVFPPSILHLPEIDAEATKGLKLFAKEVLPRIREL